VNTLAEGRITGFDLDNTIRDLVHNAHALRGDNARGLIAASVGAGDRVDTCIIVITGDGATSTVERAQVLFRGGLL